MRLTTKISEWKVGESVQHVQIGDGLTQEVAKVVTGLVVDHLKAAGHTPATVSVDIVLTAIETLPEKTRAEGGADHA